MQCLNKTLSVKPDSFSVFVKCVHTPCRIFYNMFYPFQLDLKQACPSRTEKKILMVIMVLQQHQYLEHEKYITNCVSFSFLLFLFLLKAYCNNDNIISFIFYFLIYFLPAWSLKGVKIFALVLMSFITDHSLL